MDSLKKMFQVLIKPAQVFGGLQERPVFLVPLAVFIMMTIIFTAFNMSAIVSGNTKLPKISEKQITQAKADMRKSGMSQEEIAKAEKEMRNPRQAMGNQPAFIVILPVIFSAIGLCISFFLTAVLFFLAMTIFNPANKSFKAVLATVAFSWAPLIFRDVLQTFSVIATKKMITETGLAKAFGLTMANSFSSIGKAVTYTILSRIDLFAVWSLVLLVIGLVVVFSLSYKKAVSAVSAYFILSSLLVVIPTVVGAISNA